MTGKPLSETIIKFFTKCCLDDYNSDDASEILRQIKALEKREQYYKILLEAEIKDKDNAIAHHLEIEKALESELEKHLTNLIDEQVIPLQIRCSKAESEVKRLNGFCDLCIQKNRDEHERLAKAQELIEKWREGIDASQPWVQPIIKEEDIGSIPPKFTNMLVTVPNYIKRQDQTKRRCADELEKVLNE